MSNMFKDFDEKELEILWNLLKKLATYDKSSWSGYEEKVKIE